MSKTVRKRMEGDCVKPTAPEAESEELLRVPSRFPVTAAANYSPPQYVEMLAHQMAAQALPPAKNREKYKKIFFGSPVQRAQTTSSWTSKRNTAQHGPLYDATYETGRLAVSLIGAGLKGKLHHSVFLYRFRTQFCSSSTHFFALQSCERLPQRTCILFA